MVHLLVYREFRMTFEKPSHSSLAVVARTSHKVSLFRKASSETTREDEAFIL